MPALEPYSATDVDKEVGRVFVEPPTESRAQFEVGADQDMGARADKVLCGFSLTAVAKNTKVFDVGFPTLSDRDLENRGRSRL